MSVPLTSAEPSRSFLYGVSPAEPAPEPQMEQEPAAPRYDSRSSAPSRTSDPRQWGRIQQPVSRPILLPREPQEQLAGEPTTPPARIVRPAGLNPSLFSSPDIARQHGGDPKQWAAYNEHRRSEAEAAGKHALAEQNRVQKAVAADAERKAKHDSLTDVLAQGGTPSLDDRTQRHFPKLDPATGKPEARPFTTGDRPDPYGGRIEIKRNNTGELEIDRSKSPPLRDNLAADPSDYAVYRGEERIDAVKGLVDPDPGVRARSAVLLRKKREKEIDDEDAQANMTLAERFGEDNFSAEKAKAARLQIPSLEKDRPNENPGSAYPPAESAGRGSRAGCPRR